MDYRQKEILQKFSKHKVDLSIEQDLKVDIDVFAKQITQNAQEMERLMRRIRIDYEKMDEDIERASRAYVKAEPMAKELGVDIKKLLNLQPFENAIKQKRSIDQTLDNLESQLKSFNRVIK